MVDLQEKRQKRALFVICIYFLGFSCFLTGQTKLPQQAKPSEQRVLHFPADYSIGKIYVEPATTEYHRIDVQTNFQNDTWKYLSGGRGNVTIPEGFRAELRINPDHVKTPECFKALLGLKPDDLYSIKCDNWQSVQPIPDECVSAITALTGLKELSLVGFTLSDPALKQLGKMPSLMVLNAPYINNAGLKEITQIKSLKVLILFITRCSDKSISLLKDLPQLEALCLGGPNFTDFAMRHLPQIPKLTALSLRSNVSDASAPYLAKCPSLKHLFVATQAYSDEGVKHLSKIKTLESLYIPSAYGITDAGIVYFKDMPNLKNLSIPFAELTDNSMPVLAEMTQLEHLDISSDKITDTGIEALCKLTNLKYLAPSHSSNSLLTDASLEAISKLTNLEGLDCSSELFTVQGVEKLASLKKLRRLGMGFGDLDDHCLEVIAGMEHMESLSLSGLTVGGINKLNRLTKLKDVQFRKVKKDGQILNLSGLNQLEYIYLIMEIRYDEKTRNQKELFLSDCDIQCFVNKPNLNFFCISGIGLDDENFKIIAAMKSLNNLQLSGPTRLTDHAFEWFSPESPMHVMRIKEGHFTAAGLKSLEKLKNLEILALTSDTAFAPKDVIEFKKNSPVKDLQLKP